MMRFGIAGRVLKSHCFALERRRSLATSSLSSLRQKSGKVYLWYPALGGLAIGGAIHFAQQEFGGWEGIARCVSFYSTALPKYAEYRYHMWRQSPPDVWDRLDRDTSQVALRKMLELKAFYIKAGQMCAANMGNAFPKIWQETMAPLQDQCPCKDFDLIKEIVEGELKVQLSTVFATFDRKPMGAASIGQVHRATLLDGTPVVVKVMYPEVERLFRGDVRTIKSFSKLAQPVHVPAIEEMEKQFMNEFDYVKEAKQLDTVRKNLMQAGLAGTPPKPCTVPKPYLDLCRKRILVMEELKGDKLVVALEKDLERQAKRSGKTVTEVFDEQRGKEEAAAASGTVHLGPTASEFERYRSILDAKRRSRNFYNMLYNLALGWVPGMSWRPYDGKDVLPLNTAQLVDDLIFIHGHEVLVDGYFQGDPHPGNVLLLGVQEGKPLLGLIDYGQVKQLPDDMRLLMCRMVIALDDENRDEIVELMKEAGYKSKHMNSDNIYLYAKVGYAEDNDHLTGGQHIQLFMEALQDKDPIYALPRDWLMVSRTSIMLRGLAHALKQSRNVARIWRPIAERELEKVPSGNKDLSDSSGR